MELFGDRLKWLLAGRRLHPWANGLGVSRGAAESMGRGQLPGAEILRLIRQREGVSLDWLISGEGQPFICQRWQQPRALTQMLQREAQLAADAGDEPPCLYWFSDGAGCATPGLLLVRPALLLYRQRTLAGQGFRLGWLQLDGLPEAAALAPFEHRLQRCEPALLAQLRAGERGPWQLLEHCRNQPGEALTGPLPLQVASAAEDDDGQGPVPTALMRAVIELVERTAEEEQILLDAGQRARLYTATLRYARRQQLSPSQLSVSPPAADSVLALCELLG